MAQQAFPYQVEGAGILAGRERYGLHDEMGVGKTATTILAVDRLPGCRGVVVAPAMLRQNWINEFRKFSDYPYTLCKGSNIHDFVAWRKGKFDILVTSYEQATKWSPDIQNMGEVLDFVAIDEAHYLKNNTTKRTRAILGDDQRGPGSLTAFAERVWHITGTPMANDPLDVFTFLAMCDSIGTWTQAQFVKYFFHRVPTAFGARHSCRPETLPELQALIANNAIRRTKESVGMQLPPIFMTTTVVDGDTDELAAMLREHPGLESSIITSLDLGGLSFLDAQFVATLRRLIGAAKAVPYSHMLIDELRSGAGKRVVFGTHKDALRTVRDMMWKHGVKVVMVTGDTPEHERQEAVRAFQCDDDCMVFVGNIKAAGVGLTLTASCEIDMLESDWTPAGNAQAIMRIHRIGQTKNVRARFITLAKSFDEVVNEIVARKTAAIAQIEGNAMQAAPLDVLSQFA